VENLKLYLILMTPPLGLWALFALFRWRYVRLVRQTIYGAPVHTPEGLASSGTPRENQLTLNWIDAASAAEMSQPEKLHAALYETRRARRLLIVPAAIFIVCAALVVWDGHRHVGRPVNAAIALAYFSTLTGVFIATAFSGRTPATWLMAAIGWLAGAAILLTGPLNVPLERAPSAILSGLDYGFLPIPCIALLVPRRIRPLVIAFVSLIGIFAIVSVGLLFVVPINADEIARVRTSIWAAGLVAGGLGIGTTVWQIRKGLRLWYIGALAALVGVWIVSLKIYPWLPLTFIGGIGTNGFFTLLAWTLFAGLRRAKERGLLPDEILHFAFCWLVFSGFLPLLSSAARYSLLGAAESFALFLVALVLTTASHRRLGPVRAPARMLLLRVFGREPFRGRLVDLLDDTWRRIGRIDLVVGADLAVRTMSATALEGFLLGRINRQLLDSIPQADARLARLPERPALDGRYPLNELHCSADVWQHVVTGLALDAHVLLMDLRGLQATNTGAMFELSLVIERVRLGRLVLLTDATTDEATLEETVRRTWQHLPDGSANARLVDPKVDVLRCVGPRPLVDKAIANCVFRAAERVMTPTVLPAHAG
jgi:hypothetical protein